jgi:hypothetical protein
MPSISFLWLLAFWRSILKLKGLSNMKGTSFPSGRNQFEEMQTKKTGGLNSLSSVLIVLIDH